MKNFFKCILFSFTVLVVGDSFADGDANECCKGHNWKVECCIKSNSVNRLKHSADAAYDTAFGYVSRRVDRKWDKLLARVSDLFSCAGISQRDRLGMYVVGCDCESCQSEGYVYRVVLVGRDGDRYAPESGLCCRPLGRYSSRSFGEWKVLAFGGSDCQEVLSDTAFMETLIKDTQKCIETGDDIVAIVDRKFIKRAFDDVVRVMAADKNVWQHIDGVPYRALAAVDGIDSVTFGLRFSAAKIQLSSYIKIKDGSSYVKRLEDSAKKCSKLYNVAHGCDSIVEVNFCKNVTAEDVAEAITALYAAEAKSQREHCDDDGCCVGECCCCESCDCTAKSCPCRTVRENCVCRCHAKRECDLFAFRDGYRLASVLVTHSDGEVSASISKLNGLSVFASVKKDPVTKKTFSEDFCEFLTNAKTCLVRKLEDYGGFAIYEEKSAKRANDEEHGKEIFAVCDEVLILSISPDGDGIYRLIDLYNEKPEFVCVVTDGFVADGKIDLGKIICEIVKDPIAYDNGIGELSVDVNFACNIRHGNTIVSTLTVKNAGIKKVFRILYTALNL